MKPWRRMISGLVFAMVCASTCLIAEDRLAAGSEPAFVFKLNFDSIRKSAIGASLIDRGKALLKKHTSEVKDMDLSLENINKMLAFDPLTEIRSLSVSAADFESPEKTLVATVELNQTTGNLEGFFLGLPNYEATDYGKLQIHSFKDDGNMQLFASIFNKANNDKSLLIASRKDDLTRLIDQLEATKGGTTPKKDESLASKQMISLHVSQFPKLLEGEGAHSNVVKMLKSISLDLLDGGDDLVIRLSLAAASEKKAEQIRQLVQGAAAMVDLLMGLDDDTDEDLKKLAQFVKGVKIERDGASVSTTLSIPGASLKSLADEFFKELDLDLDVDVKKESQ